MTKINRPARLIAYDTDENMQRRVQGGSTVVRLIRPRTLLYAGLIGLIGVAMIYQLATRARFAMSVLHENAPMFVVLKDGRIRNAYTLRFSNKWDVQRSFDVNVSGPADAAAESPDAVASADRRLNVTVPPDATREMRVFVAAPRASIPNKSAPISITAVDPENGETVHAQDHFIAP